MTQDHYSILGVVPTAENEVIRAAYLALMRCYHPDRNSSPAAAARVRAITAAYAVVGDPDKRDEYDWAQARIRAAGARENRPSHRAKMFASIIALARASGRRIRSAYSLVRGRKRLTEINLVPGGAPEGAAATRQVPWPKSALTLLFAVAAAAAARGRATVDALIGNWRMATTTHATRARTGCAEAPVSPSPWLPRPSPVVIFGTAGLLLLLLFLLIPPLRSVRDLPAERTNVQSARAARPEAHLDPLALCSSPRTSDEIKRELFRHAARLRRNDRRALERLASYSAIRMNSQSLSSTNSDLKTFSCTASVAVDLPPGVAVAGGRRSLTGNIEYTLKPVDGRGLKVIAVSDGGMSRILSTLAQTPRPPDTNVSAPDAPAEVQAGTAQVGQAPTQLPPPPARVQPPQPVPEFKASFSCRFARSRWEIAVCGDANLAALDRNLALLYSQSVGRADAEKRALLFRSHDLFAARRDGCSSESCIRSLYVSRMREVTDIMKGQQPPG